MVVRVVLQALLANRRRIEPVGKGEREFLARLRPDGFMVSDGEKERHLAERLDLAGLKVEPRLRQIVLRRRLGCSARKSSST